jgi:hypothetical protein
VPLLSIVRRDKVVVRVVIEVLGEKAGRGPFSGIARGSRNEDGGEALPFAEVACLTYRRQALWRCLVLPPIQLLTLALDGSIMI